MKNAVSGFASAGLWPFNSDIFTDEHFAASMITDEPIPSSISEETTSSSAPVMDQVSGHCSSPDLDQSVVCQLQSKLPVKLAQQNSLSEAKQLVEELSPIPRAEKERVRKRKAESAEVITGSPYRTMLIEKNNSKRQPNTKKIEKPKKEKIKKKLTCRKDFPKRSKVSNNTKKSKSSKPNGGKQSKKKVVKVVAPTKDTSKETCFCGEVYIDLPTEPWIQCRVCTGWYHEACTAGEGPNGFVCDNCD